MRKPFHYFLFLSIWLSSFVALLPLFLVPEWWPLWVPIHLLGAAFVIYPTLSANCDWFGLVVRSFQTDRKEVWLTIDDGPHAVSIRLNEMKPKL